MVHQGISWWSFELFLDFPSSYILMVYRTVSWWSFKLSFHGPLIFLLMAFQADSWRFFNLYLDDKRNCLLIVRKPVFCFYGSWNFLLKVLRAVFMFFQTIFWLPFELYLNGPLSHNLIVQQTVYWWTSLSCVTLPYPTYPTYTNSEIFGCGRKRLLLTIFSKFVDKWFNMCDVKFLIDEPKVLLVVVASYK